jgi:hypothetical protein
LKRLDLIMSDRRTDVMKSHGSCFAGEEAAKVYRLDVDEHGKGSWKVCNGTRREDQTTVTVSLWEWRRNSKFWRPPKLDESVQRVEFVVPSCEDWRDAERLADPERGQLEQVGLKLASEMVEIIRFYPRCEAVVFHVKTGYPGPGPYDARRFQMMEPFSGLLLGVKRDLVLEMDYSNDLRLTTSVVGYSDKEVPKLRFADPQEVERHEFIYKREVETVGQHPTWKKVPALVELRSAQVVRID